jgi:hypothetical protein
LELLQSSQSGVYNYVFTHAPKFNGWGPDYAYCYGYPCHAADLVFEFDPLPGQIWNFTPQEQLLSRQMMSFYTNFMRNGDPNVGLAVPAQWPKWSPQSKASLFFQVSCLFVCLFVCSFARSFVCLFVLLHFLTFETNLNVSMNYNNDACSFWDRVGYNHGFRNITTMFNSK